MEDAKQMKKKDEKDRKQMKDELWKKLFQALFEGNVIAAASNSKENLQKDCGLVEKHVYSIHKV
jgi:hypothetical protein